jgi:head-tail adaptor
MIGPPTSLILQRYTSTPDGNGGFVNTWAAVRTFTGLFLTLDGDETLDAMKQTVICSHKFIIDFPFGITINERDRFVNVGSTIIYNIVMVKDLANAHNWLSFKLKTNI